MSRQFRPSSVEFLDHERNTNWKRSSVYQIFHLLCSHLLSFLVYPMFVTVWVTMEQDIYGIIHNVRILVNHYDHNNSTHNTVMSSSPGPVSALRMVSSNPLS